MSNNITKREGRIVGSLMLMIFMLFFLLGSVVGAQFKKKEIQADCQTKQEIVLNGITYNCIGSVD